MALNSIDIRHRLTAWVIAGRSLVCFGGAIVIGSIITAYFLDSLTIDVVALVVISLGFGVAEGRDRSARWSLAIMAYYAILAVLLLTLALRWRHLLHVGNHAARAEDMPLITVTCGVVL